jgi:hypothetical protein
MKEMGKRRGKRNPSFIHSELFCVYADLRNQKLLVDK